MAIELKEVATITGHKGLFKVIKPTHQGVLVESLDEQRTRSVKGLQRNQVTTLEDISIYTTGEENLPLPTLIWQLYAEFANKVDEELCDTLDKRRSLMQRLVPDHDPDRVHDSSIKKIVHWYNQLVQYLPEVFEAPKEDPLT